MVISEHLGYKIRNNLLSPENRTRKSRKPCWQFRIENDIKRLRAEIGRLTQYINNHNNRSDRLIKAVEQIFRNTRIHSSYENNNTRPDEFLDTLKQKLALKSQRLSRYLKALQRKEDNKLFINNEKRFYR